MPLRKNQIRLHFHFFGHSRCKNFHSFLFHHQNQMAKGCDGDHQGKSSLCEQSPADVSVHDPTCHPAILHEAQAVSPRPFSFGPSSGGLGFEAWGHHQEVGEGLKFYVVDKPTQTTKKQYLCKKTEIMGSSVLQFGPRHPVNEFSLWFGSSPNIFHMAVSYPDPWA